MRAPDCRPRATLHESPVRCCRTQPHASFGNTGRPASSAWNRFVCSEEATEFNLPLVFAAVHLIDGKVHAINVIFATANTRFTSDSPKRLEMVSVKLKKDVIAERRWRANARFRRIPGSSRSVLLAGKRASYFHTREARPWRSVGSFAQCPHSDTLQCKCTSDSVHDASASWSLRAPLGGGPAHTGSHSFRNTCCFCVWEPLK